MALDSFIKTGTKRTNGLCWETEEDAALIEVCKQHLDRDGGLKPGWVSLAHKVLQHRTPKALRGRLSALVSRKQVPLTWMRHTPLGLPEWSVADTGWIAGIFDGEGSLFVGRNSEGTTRINLTICTNTDAGIIARVLALMGATVCVGVHKKHKAHWKECSGIVVRRFADILEVIDRLTPHVTHLGKRRKLLEALAYIQRNKS